MSKLAVLGYGVVGSGVVELFYKNKESILKKANKYNPQALWKCKIVFVNGLSDAFLFNKSIMLQQAYP
jgi:homoserine dehydrogenase